MMFYKRINEDYLDDIDRDDVISRIEDDDRISYDYMLDIPMPERDFLKRVRRLDMFLSSLPFVQDYDIAIATSNVIQENKSDLFGKYSERIEELEPLKDGLVEYAFKWRIRFNIKKLRFEKLLKFLRELINVADGYYHAATNNSFGFILYDKDEYLNKADLYWLIAVMDNRVQTGLNNAAQQFAFVFCLQLVELFGCDYDKSLSYLIQRFRLNTSMFRSVFTNFCSMMNGMKTVYFSSILASRMGYEKFVKFFETTSVTKERLKTLCENGNVRFFQAKLNSLDKQTYALLNNSLQKQLEVNEFILDYVPEQFNITTGDVRLMIKGTDSRYVHLMFLGCFDVEGETSALVAMLEEPIKGKRGIPAAMKRIYNDYELLG